MSGVTLVWTALPAGIRRDAAGVWQARVSVFITPRLEGAADGSARLRDFPALVEWPETLRDHAFRLQLSDSSGPVGEAETRPPAGADTAPDSVAWQRLFPKETPVLPFEPPDDPGRTGSRMLACESRGVVRDVRTVYAQTLRIELGEQASVPTPGRFATVPVPSGELSVTDLAERWAGTTDPLERFVLFHSRVHANGRRRPGASPEDSKEFHRLVASVGTHPHLLRRLGLVLDLSVPVEELGLDRAGEQPCLQVEPADPALGSAVHVAPRTALEHWDGASGDYRIFTVAHEGWVRRRGFLDVGAEQVAVFHEQVEHAALSLIQAQRSAAANGKAAPPPALLQGGLRLAHRDHSASVERAVADQARLESWLQGRRRVAGEGVLRADAGDEPLFAEQLTRGHRVDVRDEDEGPWRSLCRRRVRYEADGWAWPSRDTLEEEGTIEPSAQSDDDGETSVLRPPEDLFEWDGWSLVVPRPGEPVDGGPEAPEVTLPLQARVEVAPGSLQKQRFGRRYRFRVRLVDLAGNGLTTEEADAVADGSGVENVATPPVRCLRVESAKPPVLVRAQPRGPGEAGDVVVVRDADHRAHRTAHVRFHVLPPEVPLRLAERHGLFDGMTAAESWRVISDHGGELPEEMSTPEMPAPYLPDPLVRQGVVLLPGEAGAVAIPSFEPPPWRTGRRELARSCGLVVRAGSRLRARVEGRSVVVEVPRGRAVKIALAARLSAAEVPLFAQCEWLAGPDPGLAARREASPPSPARLAEHLERGAVPLLAPPREITLVHATQRPLEAPRFARPTVTRSLDATSATLVDGGFRLDAPSTGRLDLVARWQDPIDDPAADGWAEEDREMPAVGVAVSDERPHPLDPSRGADTSALSHDFGDTRHHEVSYQAVGTSRFAGFYPRALTEEPGTTTRTSEPVVVHVPATAPPAPPDVAYVLPTLRHVASTPPATTTGSGHHAVQLGDGLRIYMERGWFSSGKGERLAVVLATPETPRELRPGLSTWGANPLHDGAPLPGPLELRHVRGGWRRLGDWPHGGGSVGLVVLDVQFGEEHGLPFADVELVPQPAFMPLVRLALARYQEHALDGCHLSRVVHADFVRLAPGRVLTVRQTAEHTWSVVLGGFSHGRDPGETTVVRAQLEARPATTPDEAAAWCPLGEPVPLEPASRAPHHFRWSGQLRMEDPRLASDAWRLRLVVREVEVFDAGGGGGGRERPVSVHVVGL